MHYLNLQKAELKIKRYLINKSHWFNWLFLKFERSEDNKNRTLGMLRYTHKRCSCWMCGNPRKYFKERTRKELIAQQSFKEQLKEIESDQ